MGPLSETPDAPPQSLAGLSIEDLLAFLPEGNGRLNDKMGVQLVEVSAERVVATMPVEGNTQPFGLLHGGATAALCETVGSIGTSIHVGLERIPVGIQLSVNHLRAVRTGKVTATGVPVHIGRTTALWDILVEDDEGRRVAAGRLTLAIRDATPGARS
jgi:uncharacterized protein (TIGR00369 family)